MPAFEIKVDQQQLDDAKRIFSGFPEIQNKVHYRALNKAMTGVRTDMTTASEKVLAVEDKKQIKDVITIKKASLNSPSANVKGTGKPIELSKYVAQQMSMGVMVKVLWGKPASLIKHAFLSRMKTGHRGVYWREKRETVKPFRPGVPYGKLPKKYRFPIKQLYGPSVADSLKRPGILDGVIDKSHDRLHDAYDNILSDEMRKF
ncbi:MAG: hypothetical protein WC119_10145 [Synergistaceae bacterium]|jgi:hypothetical protein